MSDQAELENATGTREEMEVLAPADLDVVVEEAGDPIDRPEPRVTVCPMAGTPTVRLHAAIILASVLLWPARRRS